MRRVVVAALLIAAAACDNVTASDDFELKVTLTPKAGSSTCVNASPDPASIKVNDGISFVNSTSATVTIVLATTNTPLVTVAASATSGGVKFTSAGTREYYIQACGSAAAELHTINVTVN